MQGDVSFTFLDRIEEVELNIVDRRWQSALALALTLPDICGGIAFPEIVKHYRDGRVMLDRQKNPTRDVGTQYIRWFDEYAGDYFKLSQSDEKPYICGERCWQLRCEYLHQNKGFLNDENNIRFHLGLNCGMSVTFFRYNRDTKFERGTKHWQKEWQVSIKKDVLSAEYVKILVRWQLSKFTMDVMLW